METASDKKILLAKLHQAQDQDGYITPQAIRKIAAAMELSEAEVYEAASFYSFFYLEPQGCHLIQICESAPCHVAGAQAVVDALESRLGIRMGETTKDGRITLKFTQCFGQCQDAPVVIVDGELWRRADVEMVEKILNSLA